MYQQQASFHERLYSLIDAYVHFLYKISKKFPKEELFGSSNQLRRAGMSVMLNYQEGYARRRKLVKLNFYEISYGSCKESRYLVDFSYKESWISNDDFEIGMKLSDEIAGMLWKTIQALQRE